jgi:phosphonopyruvate decarboxylase
MINVKKFVDEIIQQGAHFFTGVPCSYLTPLINEVIARDETQYVLASNEGEALSLASGLWLASQTAVVLCQNSGLGNLINPLTSLSEPFSIPALLLVTWRGQPSVKDEPQHTLMGKITPRLLTLSGVRWALLPDDEAQALQAVRDANEYMRREQRPFALVMTGDQFSAGPSFAQQAQGPSRADALRVLLECADPQGIMIATTGKTGRELFTLSDRPEHLYCVGSMGYASALAAGIALGCTQRKVYVIDGDGAALMHLGNMVGIGANQPLNLIHIVLDNGSYDSTGAQPTASASVDFVKLAEACGYAQVQRCNGIVNFAQALSAPITTGPQLLHVPIRPGSMAQLGRPTLSPFQVARRLRGLLASTAQPDDAATSLHAVNLYQ